MTTSMRSDAEQQGHSFAAAHADHAGQQSADAGIVVQNRLADAAQNGTQSAAQLALDSRLNGSSRMSLQRMKMADVSVAPAQLAAEEEELQMKRIAARPIQLAAEEEELQMKPIAARPMQLAAEEEELQMKPIAARPMQLAAEEEELQMKRIAGGPIQREKNNTGMPDNLKAGVESLSGMAMDDVKVHYNSDKPAAVQAHAYAQGSDIHVAPGQEQHLPHEAWHVVQQRQGRVQPTMQAAGMAINDDPGLEAEADAMGAKALQAKPLEHE